MGGWLPVRSPGPAIARASVLCGVALAIYSGPADRGSVHSPDQEVGRSEANATDRFLGCPEGTLSVLVLLLHAARPLAETTTWSLRTHIG